MRVAPFLFALALTAATAGVALAGAMPEKSSKRSPEHRIEREVVRRLDRQLERRFMFSRARALPPKRKVETLARQVDSEGRTFVPFVVES
ncbi:MAG: hypothetical protein AAF658_09075, partial [Myxococcota bacterium]